jgi:hypothetical protein
MILFQQPNGMIQLSQKHLGYLERCPSHMIQLVGRVSFVDLANIQNSHVLHLLCWFFNQLTFLKLVQDAQKPDTQCRKTLIGIRAGIRSHREI